jgi:citrate lyase subunit beta/citryl-CoA lyase
VRINDLRTPWCYRDLIEIVDSARSALNRIVVPKVRSTGDLAFVDRLLTQLEIEYELETPIAIEAQIEDPEGLLAVAEIAKCSPRLKLLTFGQGDFAAAAGMPAREIGVRDEWDDAATGDRWQLPRQMIVLAAAAAGIQALNGPYAAFRDADGFHSYCGMSRSLGFAGVWCIHPEQIEIANEVFSPTTAEIERAQHVVEAGMRQGEIGHGAFDGEGVMRDEATLRMARRTLAIAEALSLRQSKTGG